MNKLHHLVTHNMSKTKIYRTWADMNQRCNNPNNKSFKNYGGRGITVSEEFHNFQVWYKCIGPKPGPEYTQDRTNNEGNYEQGNIRWGTWKEQNNNSRSCSCGPRPQYWFFAYNTKTGEWDESNSQNEFALKHYLDNSCICACLNGKRKQHKGWLFEKI